MTGWVLRWQPCYLPDRDSWLDPDEMNTFRLRDLAVPAALLGIGTAALTRVLEPGAWPAMDSLLFGAFSASYGALTVSVVLGYSRLRRGRPLLASHQQSRIHVSLPLEDAASIARDALAAMGTRVRTRQTGNGIVVDARYRTAKGRGANLSATLTAFSSDETSLAIESRAPWAPRMMDPLGFHLGYVQRLMFDVMEREERLLGEKKTDRGRGLLPDPSDAGAPHGLPRHWRDGPE